MIERRCTKVVENSVREFDDVDGHFVTIRKSVGQEVVDEAEEGHKLIER